MKYRVEKDFLDRFDNHRHCKPGEPHDPPSTDRAQQLLEQGFISQVKDELVGGEGDKKRPGRKKKDVKPEVDTDGEATAE